jgi:hypothetical protein
MQLAPVLSIEPQDFASDVHVQPLLVHPALDFSEFVPHGSRLARLAEGLLHDV